MIKDLILKSYFSKFLDSWGLSNNSILEENGHFEKFVNYLILSADDSSTFVGNPDLLDFCCTGGGDDAKLDGVGIKINGRIVGSKEDIDQIVNNSKKIEVEFFIIQSKEKTDFDSAEFNTFAIGAQNFFSSPKLPENDSVKALRELKDYIFNEPSVIKKLDDNPSVAVYFAFCGTVPEDEHTKAICNIAKENLTKAPDSLGRISVDILGSLQLKELCKSIDNDFQIELTVCDIIPLSVQSNPDIKKAYTFTCDAEELLRLLTKEDGTIRRSLFNDNVRDYLGNRGNVNSEIEDTIVHEPEMFLMCNNGITIVCTNFLQVRDKLVSIQNPQVVNGCQTCNSIFAHRLNSSLKKVQVLVKLICTEELTITNKIVRGTNKQNQVLEESFETTRPFHQELEDFFIAKRDIVQLYYERRNKQYSSNPTINKYQIVNLRVITQTFVALFLKEPHVAHRHEAKLLESFAGNEEDRVIYKDGQSYAPYYISALTWFKFEEAFRNGIISKKLKPYKAHLYLIFAYTTGMFPITIGANNKAIESYCTKLELLLTSSDLSNTLAKVINIFNHCVKLWTQNGSGKYSIKEKKEFTVLLEETARKALVNKTIEVSSTNDIPEIVSWSEGVILNIRIKDGNWFGFIRENRNVENVYFDNRAFSGDFKNLLPGTKVRFLKQRKRARETNAYYAKEVKIVKQDLICPL